MQGRNRGAVVENRLADRAGEEDVPNGEGSTDVHTLMCKTGNCWEAAG